MAEGSSIALFAALAGNLAVAAVKFAAWAISGSSAMLTEAIHSVVDSLNQLVLLFGINRSRKPADDTHPFGHGLEAYFWTFVVALLIFALGGALGLYEGLDKLLHPEPMRHAGLNLGVIAAAGVIEGLSLRTGVRSARRIRSPIARRSAGGLSFLQLIHASKDPGIYEVLAEDSAAIMGLVFAAAGVVCSGWFGLLWADGAASMAIGALLVTVAGVLVLETRSLLTGEAASQPVIDEVRRVLTEDARVQSVCRIQSMHMGPEDILVAATLDFRDELSGPQIEHAAEELTDKLKSAEPRITSVFVRPGRPDPNPGAPRTAA